MMDRDFKVPAWDFEGLDRDAEPCFGSVVLGSSGCGSQLGDVGCSVDLKLGGLEDLLPSRDLGRQPKLGHGAPKRHRNPGNGRQKVACLVDGCVADLTGCREYYRRHKVCEAHSKAPVVRVGGKEQRFCQQCSRFHSLVEFDEEKRSCRKRLDDHNRRRRKSNTDPVNSGRLFTNTQGSKLSVYPLMRPTATPETNWSGIVKSGDNAFYAPCTEGYCKERNKFPFLQEIDVTSFSRNANAIGTSAGQPHLRAFMPSASSSNASNSILFSSGSADVFYSNCVLSLQSAQTQTSSINNLGQMVPASGGQPQGFSLQCGGLDSNKVGRSTFLCPGMEDEHTSSFPVSDANDSEIHFKSGFDGAGSSDCSPPSFPFCWQ